MRKAALLVAIMSWMVIIFPFYFLPLILWPTHRWRLRMAGSYARVWASGFFFLTGLRLQVDGREHMSTCPAVYLFNHTNELDFFANALIAPSSCLVYGKRELARIPFLGWMWFLGGHPMIRRKDRSHWQRVLDETTALVASGKFSTMIAPEGTRTRDGLLLPFKKGPFHIAFAAKAPLVPIVIHGAAERLDKSGTHAGTLRLEVLPPIPTADWDESKIAEHIEAVRGLYLKALGQEPSPQP